MPFRQYWVTTPTTPGPSYQGRHFLYRFDTPSFEGCLWHAVTDHFNGPSLEELQFYQSLNDPDIMCYNVDLILVFPLGVNVWRGTFCTALPEPPGLVEPESPTSCSRMSIQLQHVILGTLSVATITPAYPEACTDDDYPEKQQTKFLAAF